MHNHVDVELPYDVTFVSEEHHLDPDGADAHLFGDVRRASAAAAWGEASHPYPRLADGSQPALHPHVHMRTASGLEACFASPPAY